MKGETCTHRTEVVMALMWVHTLADVLQAYFGACTPEFYVFDSDLKLTYHGQVGAPRCVQGSALIALATLRRVVMSSLSGCACVVLPAV